MAEQAPPLRFSTRDVAAPARRRVLSELREQGLLPLEPLPGCSPRVDLLKWRLPGASVLSGTFAGVRQGGESAGADDDLFFGINVSGASLARRRGHEITIGAGDALAHDTGFGDLSYFNRTFRRRKRHHTLRRAPPRTRIALLGGQRLCNASRATAMDAATRKSRRGSGTVMR